MENFKPKVANGGATGKTRGLNNRRIVQHDRFVIVGGVRIDHTHTRGTPDFRQAVFRLRERLPDFHRRGRCGPGHRPFPPNRDTGEHIRGGN